MNAIATTLSPVAVRSLEDLAFTADQLPDEPPERQYHVKGLIPAGIVTGLYGDGGKGKSTLAVMLSVSTATGSRWLNMDVRKGNVLYFSCEDDRDELNRRLADVARHHGVVLADLPGLKMLDLTNDEPLLAVSDRTGKLSPTPRWAELRRMAAEWEPALIVIDSLADVFGGDEISRPQARQFITQLQALASETSAAVILLAHPSVQGMTSGSGSSGSTAWNNSLRNRLYLSDPKDLDTPEPDLRVLTVKKANYGPQGGEQLLRWTRGVFVPEGGGETGPMAQAMAEAKVERIFLNLLDEFTAQGRPVGYSPAANYAPSVFSTQPEAKGIGKRALMAAMNRLLRSKQIVVVEEGPPTKRRRRLARSEA